MSGDFEIEALRCGAQEGRLTCAGSRGLRESNRASLMAVLLIEGKIE